MTLRIITLPVNPITDWATLGWPDRNALEVLRYGVDATAWLADVGETIASVVMSEIGTLSVAPVELVMAGAAITGWTVKIGGGTPGELGVVRSTVALAGGDLLIVDIALHTRADAGLVYVPVGLFGPTAPGVITLSGQVVTFGGVVITIGGA